MKVIRLDEIQSTDRQVDCPRGGFTSYRFLLASDGLGFSLHKTVIPKGDVQAWHYKHHLEACYCVSGRGVLIDWGDVREWTIEPDTVYAPDKNDLHTFQALEDTVLICVFNPPLTGHEVHRDDGSYEPSEETHVCKP